MFQGVYYNGYNFLRFYKDGTFIHCLVKVEKEEENDSTLQQILAWFDIGHPSVFQGNYKCKNSNIELQLKTAFGPSFIDYKGKQSASKIAFEILNHNTGKKSKETYKAIKLKYKPK